MSGLVFADPLAPLIGAAKAAKLAEELQIATVGELLRHYPRDYARPGQLLGNRLAQVGEHVTLIAEVRKKSVMRFKNDPSKKRMVLSVSDGINVYEVVFFNPKKWTQEKLEEGQRYMFDGEVSMYANKLQLAHPGFILLPDPDAREQGVQEPGAGKITGVGQIAAYARSVDPSLQLDPSEWRSELMAVYPASKNVSSWDVRRYVEAVLDQLAPVPDPLTEAMRAERGFLGLEESLRAVHTPESQDQVNRAKDRLRFDEALAVQLAFAKRRAALAKAKALACQPLADGKVAKFEARLPFQLTEDQRAARDEIDADLATSKPMSRLVHGEVGSGKTVVSLLAMLRVVDAGAQCAMLAPTEVLAAQHHATLRKLLGPLGRGGELDGDPDGLKIVLLTGSMGAAARKAALAQVVSGEASIVVGTHALLSEKVMFADLGLLVVDEQHRFGVDQRDALRGRGVDGRLPHLLVMTATPIPRTVAMTVFGELEVSTIKHLPKNRAGISSSVVDEKRKPDWVRRVWERMREEAAEGRQAYVVCARIQDKEKEEEKKPAKAKPKPAPEQKGPPPPRAVVDVFEELSSGPLAGLRLGLMHGGLPPAEKDKAMASFASGETQVLVSTTVIEVGVDVPNSTMMVILDADRFGISQLHQLRGRVGRGGHPGLCIFVTRAGGASLDRLQSVASCMDGFELAELDLKIRGEGDVIGVAQSGRSRSLRLLSVTRDEEIIADAREVADALAEGAQGEALLAETLDSVLTEAEAGYLEKW
ncbi:ATP-dependent DNA helicase RecG [Segniliparus rugosus]|uniref:ATP-dependent DNA helicase RecG n=1 Tax=Segniliparus rugosus (strain ATCC BAA-974 / DSM 45345 / CCUG 50838 / CIP 108380 / JCM 13579 / CDC 945) TaxID=679197 RepID=E5XMH3_SEGRC|nr:ATP-dependent DNA helicase RecG [Segniliparus rugosus]EFV14438.1 ATP-dependent DNA helicase RecG [Segniliparus rugosus ATCC BAA-974]